MHRQASTFNYSIRPFKIRYWVFQPPLYFFLTSKFFYKAVRFSWLKHVYVAKTKIEKFKHNSKICTNLALIWSRFPLIFPILIETRFAVTIPGPIPLTIKHLEEENKRKSMLVQPEMTNGRIGNGNGNNSLETWDYVYRQLENIGYTKDQVSWPTLLLVISLWTVPHRLLNYP